MTAKIRDRALFLAFASLFLGSWVGQLISEWQVYVSDQQEHHSSAVFWSGDFWWEFLQSTLENWQSEWLQLTAQVALPAYLVYKGAAQSKDSDERLEAKVDWLVANSGHDPKEIESELDPQYNRENEAESKRPLLLLASVLGASVALVVALLILYAATA